VAAAFVSSGRLLRSWRRVIETLRHGTGGAGEGTELLAVAVDPTARGRGAGTLLVEGFLNEVRRRQQSAAHVVVAADNATAVALYRRNGFHMVKRFELHSGTESLVMLWPTPDTES
jgi:ribosomal protein S18 acetylase RimI-like enzyme